jgi:hypothetical protein
MANIFRKIGRAIDPTSKKSPLGSVTRTVISSIPGGAAALGAVDTFNATTRTPTTKAGGTSSTAPATPAATPAATLAQAAAPGSTWSKLATKPAVIVGAVGAVLLLVVLLFRRR